MDSSAPTTTGAARIAAIGVLLLACLLPVGPTGRTPTTGENGRPAAALALARYRTAEPGLLPSVALPAAGPRAVTAAAWDGTAPPAPDPRATTRPTPDRTASPAGQPALPPAAAAPGAPVPGPQAPVPAPPPGAGVPAPGAGYAWPLLPPPAVLTPFRGPAHAYGPGHRGVDLAGYGGQPVLAARAGTVVFAGSVAGHGVVSVQHDDGLRTTYEPVSPTVTAGAVVRAGDVLGLLEPGHAGCPAVVCLHWGVRRDRLDYLDPLVLLRPAHVRLLPVPDPWPDGGVIVAGAT